MEKSKTNHSVVVISLLFLLPMAFAALAAEDVEVPMEPPIEHTAMGENDCYRKCPRIFMPMCGSDGKTYGNACVFEVAKCKSRGLLQLKQAGTCRSVKASRSSDIQSRKCPTCPDGVPSVFPFLCANNRKAYRNKCQFDRANCKAGGKLKLLSPLECPENDGYKNIFSYRAPSIPSGRKLPLSDQQSSITSECSQVCTKEFRPTCGSDGRRYSNPCEFRVARCKSGGKLQLAKNPDECNRRLSSTDVAQKCSQSCPRIYRPICASNGRTYANLCVFRFVSCKSGGKLRIVKDGKC